MNAIQSMKPDSDVYAQGVESDSRYVVYYAKRETFANREVVYRAGLTSANIARFRSKIQYAEGCWLWAASCFKGGYGQFHAGRFQNGKQDVRYAHRVAYELANGPIPPGLVVRHTCDVPRCVNPHHLLVGTQADNLNDARARGRLDASLPRPGAWTIEPELRRRIIAECVNEPRGTTARLAREHGLNFRTLAVAVHRERKHRYSLRGAA